MSRRIGKIYVTALLMESEHMPQALADLKFVPLRVEHLYAEDQFEMIGLSECFDKNPKGCVIPEYVFKIEVTEDMGYIGFDIDKVVP